MGTAFYSRSFKLRNRGGCLSKYCVTLPQMSIAAGSEPKDLFELVRKENIDSLMSVFNVTGLHYVAVDGCTLLMREAVDAMDDDTI